MRYILTVSLLIVFALLTSLFVAKNVFAETNHVVISQIQIGGSSATDEFIELYNPTESTVSLAGWRLTRKTSSGSQTNLVANISGQVSPHGFFLIAHPDYDGLVASDIVYSATSSSVAANNTVLLYKDAGVNLVDKVGFGTATDNEGSSFPTSPAANQSLHRKNDADDLDNNTNDFEILTVSNPRNSLFAPTITPSPTSTVNPTTTPTQIPTESPVATITPTSTPTQTPTSTPLETVPTDTPTTSASPTTNPSPTLAPTTKPDKNDSHHDNHKRYEEVRRKVQHIKEVVVNFCNKHFKFLSFGINRRGGKEHD